MSQQSLFSQKYEAQSATAVLLTSAVYEGSGVVQAAFRVFDTLHHSANNLGATVEVTIAPKASCNEVGQAMFGSAQCGGPGTDGRCSVSVTLDPAVFECGLNTQLNVMYRVNNHIEQLGSIQVVAPPAKLEVTGKSLLNLLDPVVWTWTVAVELPHRPLQRGDEFDAVVVSTFYSHLQACVVEVRV